MSHWEALSLDQLRGAEYALRLIHSSPAIRGRALEVVKEQHADCVRAANELAWASRTEASPADPDPYVEVATCPAPSSPSRSSSSS